MHYFLRKIRSCEDREILFCAQMLASTALLVGCFDLHFWLFSPQCSGKTDGFIVNSSHFLYYESPYSLEINPKPVLPEGSGLQIEFAAHATKDTFEMRFSFGSSEVTSYVEVLKQLGAKNLLLSPWDITGETFNYEELSKIEAEIEQYANTVSRTTVSLAYESGERQKIGKNHYIVSYPVALDPFLAKGQTQFEYFANDFRDGKKEIFTVQFRSEDLSGLVTCY